MGLIVIDTAEHGLRAVVGRVLDARVDSNIVAIARIDNFGERVGVNFLVFNQFSMRNEVSSAPAKIRIN